ncbi:hypothetical protein [Lysinibacillus antri]|uniref:Uncharacterized protein n=1 Tax=Lysinibacillus antri TaxID=2498145 RepID=A0A432LDY1_9BACI|nr:hypothetical protein [Lysinibacillus antri]RUL54797.1 hypothetical protein EK386_06415 [Lysinibacillus antri]
MKVIMSYKDGFKQIEKSSLLDLRKELFYVGILEVARKSPKVARKLIKPARNHSKVARKPTKPARNLNKTQLFKRIFPLH